MGGYSVSQWTKAVVDFPSLASWGSFLSSPQSWFMVLQNLMLLHGKKNPSKRKRKKKWTFFRLYVAMLLKYILLKYARKSGKVKYILEKQ